MGPPRCSGRLMCMMYYSNLGALDSPFHDRFGDLLSLSESSFSLFRRKQFCSIEAHLSASMSEACRPSRRRSHILCQPQCVKSECWSGIRAGIQKLIRLGDAHNELTYKI